MYNLYVGEIKYQDSIVTHDLINYAFTKETPYRDEQEVRVYLLPKVKELKWSPEDLTTHYKVNFNYRSTLFSNIVVSPYLNKTKKAI